MKRLLGILSSMGLVATTGVTVVACGSSNNSVELDTIITNTALGTIDDNQEATILAQVKRMNENLNLDEVVVENITENSADITAKPNSKVYKSGSVNVTFSATRQGLNVAIAIKVLGEIANNESETILAAILDKNSTFDIEQVIVSGIGNKSATIVAKDDSVDYAGSTTVTFTIAPVALDTVITVTELGELSDNQAATILAATVAANQTFDSSQVNINNITTTSALITASSSSEIYTGSVTVTFEINEQLTNLSEVITLTSLGELSDSTSNTILAKVLELNSGLNLAEVNVSANDNAGNATISANSGSTVYSGAVNVTYTVTKVELDTVVTNANLTNLNNALDTTVLSKISSENSSLDMSQVTLTSNDQMGNAVLTANSDSFNYIGFVNIFC